MTDQNATIDEYEAEAAGNSTSDSNPSDGRVGGRKGARGEQPERVADIPVDIGWDDTSDLSKGDVYFTNVAADLLAMVADGIEYGEISYGEGLLRTAAILAAHPDMRAKFKSASDGWVYFGHDLRGETGRVAFVPAAVADPGSDVPVDEEVLAPDEFVDLLRLRVAEFDAAGEPENASETAEQLLEMLRVHGSVVAREGELKSTGRVYIGRAHAGMEGIGLFLPDDPAILHGETSD